MKINVFGKGKVPGLNGLAPLYNKEASLDLVKRILAFRVFRVFDASTGLQITMKNVDEYIKAEEEEKALQQAPKINIPKVEVKPVQKAEIKVEQKPFIPPVVDEKTSEVEEVVEEVVESEPEEVIDDVIETTVDDVVEEPVIEETVEADVVTEEATTDDTDTDTTPVEVEAKMDNNYRSKRNKKKRN
jgi:hypothetical protein